MNIECQATKFGQEDGPRRGNNLAIWAQQMLGPSHAPVEGVILGWLQYLRRSVTDSVHQIRCYDNSLPSFTSWVVQARAKAGIDQIPADLTNGADGIVRAV